MSPNVEKLRHRKAKETVHRKKKEWAVARAAKRFALTTNGRRPAAD